MRRTLFALMTTMILSTSTAWAVDWAQRLAPDEEAALSAEGRALYEKGLFLIDRTDYEGGMRELAAAAETDPTSAPLQFYVLARARERAEIYYSAATFSPVPENVTYSSPQWRTSEVYYDIAEATMRRLVEATELSLEQRRRLNAFTTDITTSRAALGERDAARLKTGQVLAREIRLNRMLKMDLLDVPEGVTDPAELMKLAEEGKLSNKTGTATATVTPDENKNEAPDPFAEAPGEKIDSWMPAPPAGARPGVPGFNAVGFGPGFGGGEFGAAPAGQDFTADFAPNADPAAAAPGAPGGEMMF